MRAPGVPSCRRPGSIFTSGATQQRAPSPPVPCPVPCQPSGTDEYLLAGPCSGTAPMCGRSLASSWRGLGACLPLSIGRPLHLAFHSGACHLSRPSHAARGRRRRSRAASGRRRPRRVARGRPSPSSATRGQGCLTPRRSALRVAPNRDSALPARGKLHRAARRG